MASYPLFEGFSKLFSKNIDDIIKFSGVTVGDFVSFLHVYILSTICYAIQLWDPIYKRLSPSPCGHWHVCFSHEALTPSSVNNNQSDKTTEAWFTIAQTSNKQYRGQILFNIGKTTPGGGRAIMRVSADKIYSVKQKGFFFKKKWQIEAVGCRLINLEPTVNENSTPLQAVASPAKNVGKKGKGNDRCELSPRKYILEGKIVNSNEVELSCEIKEDNLCLKGTLRRA